MNKPERPPISEDYLATQGFPIVTSPAKGIIAIISGDGYETVDMLPEHAEHIADRLIAWAELVRTEPV